jgi:hypothetical protein
LRKIRQQPFVIPVKGFTLITRQDHYAILLELRQFVLELADAVCALLRGCPGGRLQTDCSGLFRRSARSDIAFDGDGKKETFAVSTITPKETRRSGFLLMVCKRLTR